MPDSIENLSDLFWTLSVGCPQELLADEKVRADAAEKGAARAKDLERLVKKMRAAQVKGVMTSGDGDGADQDRDEGASSSASSAAASGNGEAGASRLTRPFSSVVEAEAKAKGCCAVS